MCWISTWGVLFFTLFSQTWQVRELSLNKKLYSFVHIVKTFINPIIIFTLGTN